MSIKTVYQVLMSGKYFTFKEREEKAWIDALECVHRGELDKLFKVVLYLKKLKKLQAELPTIDA